MPREGHDPEKPSALTEALSISIHVPREGHDTRYSRGNMFWAIFLSTCPVRGTTITTRPKNSNMDISIHVPREGHDSYNLVKGDFRISISIHVPREGHDTDIGPKIGIDGEISIHVPREGHDLEHADARPKSGTFLSTCPVRGTTLGGISYPCCR